MARARLDEPECRRPRRSFGARIAALLTRPRRRRGSARCGDIPWDDDGLSPALVPRRPRPPRLGGSVALELPDEPG